MKLANLFTKSKVVEAPEFSSDDESDIINKDYERGKIEKQMKDESAAPEDMGKWNIMKTGNNIIIKNRALTIKFDSDEAFDIVSKMSEGLPIRIKTGDDTFIFRPLKRGAEYAVKSEKTSEIFPNGILISNKQIDDFMDFLAIDDIEQI